MGDVAVARATSTGVQNIVAGHHLSGSELGVETGYWHGESQSFSPPTGAEWAAPNAARVVGGRPGVALFFAKVLGHATTDVTQDATAIYGGGRCAGIWGLDGVIGHGSLVTDSYDSTDGVYGSGNIYYNGDICSDQDIDLMGAATIGGDAMYGEGYSLTTHGTSYEIYGGTYYFTTAKLVGAATVTITAPTTIYISGSASFAGGGITNVTGNPRNLTIYSTGSKMTINGDAGFYGVVVAPTTAVTFSGGSEIYGSVLAGILELAGDTMIHVDSGAVQDIFALGPRSPVLVE